MALEVKYDEVRSNVIAKVQELQEAMVTYRSDLDYAVDGISANRYMQGDSATAYAAEFTEAISGLFDKLNNDLQSYCDQLESVCAEFEAQDQQTSEMLNFKG